MPSGWRQNWVNRMTRHVVEGLHLSRLNWGGGTLGFETLSDEALDQIPLQGDNVVDHRANNGRGHDIINLSRVDQIVLIEPGQRPRLGKIKP